MDLNQLATLGPWGLGAAFLVALLSMWMKWKSKTPDATPSPSPDKPSPDPEPSPAPSLPNRPILNLIMQWLQKLLFQQQVAQAVVNPVMMTQPSVVEQVENNVAHLAFLNALRTDPAAWEQTVNFVRAYLMQQEKNQKSQ